MRTIEYSNISIPVSGKFLSVVPEKAILFLRESVNKLLKSYKNTVIEDGLKNLEVKKQMEFNDMLLLKSKIIKHIL